MPIRRVVSESDLQRMTLHPAIPSNHPFATKVSHFARTVFSEIIKPAGMGVLTGASMLFVWKVINVVLIYSIVIIVCSIILLLNKAEDVKFVNETQNLIRHATYDSHSEKPPEIFKTCISAPLTEEAFFRVIALDTFKWVAVKILPDKKINTIWFRVKLSTLVCHTATSLWFGLTHYRSRGIITVICGTFFGMGLGILKEKYGMISPIAAHMTINSLSTLQNRY